MIDTKLLRRKILDEEFNNPNNQKIALKNAGKYTSGNTPSNSELASKGDVPYFKVSDMNTLGNEVKLSLTNLYLKGDYRGKVFPKNSIVFPKNGGAVLTNKRRLLAQDSVVDLNTGVFTANENTDPGYLYYYFTTIDFGKHYIGTTIPTINNKIVEELQVYLPPLAEQQRIVARIKTMFEQIDIIDRNQAQLKYLAKCAKAKILDFQFNKSELDRTLLGTIVTISGGGTPDKSNSRFWNGDIPWASVKDMKGDYIHSTKDTITEAGLKSKSSIAVCEPGDLIVATRLVLGKSVMPNIRTSINQDLKRLRPSNKITSKYLHYWFKANEEYFTSLGQGTTVLGIRLNDLKDALIPLPPIAEQERIVARVEALFEQIDVLLGGGG